MRGQIHAPTTLYPREDQIPIVQEAGWVVQALRICRGRTAHRESRGIALLFLDHGTRRGEGSESRPGRSLPPGKTRYPLYRRLGGPHGRSGCGKSRLHQDSIPRPSSRYPVAIPTTLPDPQLRALLAQKMRMLLKATNMTPKFGFIESQLTIWFYTSSVLYLVLLLCPDVYLLQKQSQRTRHNAQS